MKRLCLILLCCFLPSFAQQLAILHTNDTHAQFEPAPATWVQKNPKPLIGGMTALEYFISKEREKQQPILLLDAGDIMTGTPIAKIVRDGGTA